VGVEFVLHPLIHTAAPKNLAQDVEKKSGAKESAFSQLKTKYCSLVLKRKVGIKVCNIWSPLKNEGNCMPRPTAASGKGTTI